MNQRKGSDFITFCRRETFCFLPSVFFSLFLHVRAHIYCSLSFVFFDLVGNSLANLKVLPVFNECYPGCPPGVYFYDASEISLTRLDGGEGSKRTAVGWKRHEATITIGEFLLLRSLILHLVVSRPSFFHTEHDG